MVTHWSKTKKAAQRKAKYLRKYGNRVYIKKIGRRWNITSIKD